MRPDGLADIVVSDGSGAFNDYASADMDADVAHILILRAPAEH